jgi:hypothetical protein
MTAIIRGCNLFREFANNVGPMAEGHSNQLPCDVAKDVRKAPASSVLGGIISVVPPIGKTRSERFVTETSLQHNYYLMTRRKAAAILGS